MYAQYVPITCGLDVQCDWCALGGPQSHGVSQSCVCRDVPIPRTQWGQGTPAPHRGAHGDLGAAHKLRCVSVGGDSAHSPGLGAPGPPRAAHPSQPNWSLVGHVCVPKLCRAVSIQPAPSPLPADLRACARLIHACASLTHGVCSGTLRCRNWCPWGGTSVSPGW